MIDATNLIPVRRGADLKSDMESYQSEDLPMAEGFLYEKKVSMIYADAGSGKSTIAQQLAMELSGGQPVFGNLACPRKFHVYYLQLEGDYSETIDRMKLMCEKIKPSLDWLCWDAGVMGLNALDEHDIKTLCDRIRSNCVAPDLIIIDPIYQAIYGDLIRNEIANAYCRFSTYLQRQFDCAILHIHHTPKESYTPMGEKIAKDTFFGSSFFKNHVNSLWYYKTVNKEEGTSILINKKTRNSNMLPQIPLCYDMESHTVYMETDESKKTPYDRLVDFMTSCNKENKLVSIYDITEHLKPISDKHARRLVHKILSTGIAIKIRSDRGKNLYKIRTK